MVKSKEKVGVETDLESFGNRIKAAMQVCGMTPATPPRLVSAWERHYGSAQTPTRQAFSLWLKQKKPKISPQNLFMLADLLDVNARWLLQYGDERRSIMTKPLFPDPELRTCIDAYTTLLPGARADLVDQANRLVRAQQEASRGNPYPAPQKPR